MLHSQLKERKGGGHFFREDERYSFLCFKRKRGGERERRGGGFIYLKRNT